MSLFLVLLAAGDGKRLKSRLPKPYNKVNNKTLLEHSLSSFSSISKIKKIIVVYNKKHKKFLKNCQINNSIKIIGGKTRQESTFKALKKIKKMGCSKVLIHDVARPLVSKSVINKIIYKLSNYNAVIPIIKINDATKRVNGNLVFIKHLRVLLLKKYFKNTRQIKMNLLMMTRLYLQLMEKKFLQ